MREDCTLYDDLHSSRIVVGEQSARAATFANLLKQDALEVPLAAGTKWNFLPFRAGLVGGQCIGVDPHYLTQKAEMLGYDPQVTLAGRRMNDGMAAFVAQQTIKRIIDARSHINGAKVVVLRLAFKENGPDIRNSRVADLVRELQDHGREVLVHDSIAEPTEAGREYGIESGSVDLELAGRNAAPTLTLAARAAREARADPVLVATPSGQTITDTAAFSRAMHTDIRDAHRRNLRSPKRLFLERRNVRAQEFRLAGRTR